MLAAVDEAIGQIVSAIETAGMGDNTLYLFSADNGGPNPGSLSDNGPLRASKGRCMKEAFAVAPSPAGRVKSLRENVSANPCISSIGTRRL